MGVLGYEPLDEQIEAAVEGARERSKAPGASQALPIREVVPGSLAERAGFAAGDRIARINGQAIADPIDLFFHAAESRLRIEYGRAGESRLRSKTLDREPGEELGIVLEDFKIRTCNNQCIFCFIHQNPRGLRKGIYFKDGDFRMSFLHGNYITMTNMGAEDFKRIVRQRLSPMYVSVHATNHALRLKMLGVKRGSNVLSCLRKLRRGRIEFHTQIVLCPGWNDGDELDRTLGDLAELRPWLLSIAIVPLGMTDHRDRLPGLEPVTPSFCRRVIKQVEPWQAKFKARFGEPLVYLGDEFFITAGRSAPSYKDGDLLHQLENGVGMVSEFMAPWRSAARRLPARIRPSRSVAILTGMLGARVLRRIAGRLSRVDGLKIDLIGCENSLFGRSITVSGLLSGFDFRRAIAENPGYDAYLLPANAVRADGDVFLDDVSLKDLDGWTGGKVSAVDGTCEQLIEAALGTPI